jgi:hypothetical protein
MGRTPGRDDFALRTFGLFLPRVYKAVIHKNRSMATDALGI